MAFNHWIVDNLHQSRALGKHLGPREDHGCVNFKNVTRPARAKQIQVLPPISCGFT